MSKEHVVAEGECIDSIAKRYGFFPDALWRLKENDALRDSRRDRNVLMPGDVVFIPDLRVREEPGETEACHGFRRKGVPARLRVKFMRPAPPPEAPAEASGDDLSHYVEPPRTRDAGSEPLADAPFVLTIDGIITEGRTDEDGMVDVPIPPDVVQGRIRLFPGTDAEIAHDLALGEMAPIDTVPGVRRRLSNIGYRCQLSGEEGEIDLRDALQRFQTDNGLEATGIIDEDTRDVLLNKHGS
jgi:hypothetical protein